MQIESPKMRRRGARLEHVRIRGTLLTAFARAVVSTLRPENRVFTGSPAELPRSLSQMLGFFGIHAGAAGGTLTWSSLRPGGATFLYMDDVPLDTIKWRGRWAAWATLDRYIQEVASLSILKHLPAVSRVKIDAFAAAAPQALRYTAWRLGQQCITRQAL